MNEEKKKAPGTALDPNSKIQPHEEWLDAESTAGAEDDLQKTSQKPKEEWLDEKDRNDDKK